MRTRSNLLVSVLMLAVLGVAAHAQTVNPVSATASSDFNADTGASNVTTVADLNGLNEHIGETGVWRTWLSAAAPQYQNQQWILVDLGAEYELGAIRIWNYHEVAGIETSGRGFKDFSLWVGGTGATLPTGYSDGTEPTTWDKFSALTGWTNVVSGGTLARGPSSLIGNNTYPCNNTISTSATGVRYIGVDAGAYEWDGVGVGNYTGLAQIQAVLPVPPAVINTGATNTTTVAATLQGGVTAGLPFPEVTTYWGLEGDITNMIDTGTQSASFSNTISGLTAGTTYEYYFVASNVAGAATSATSSFTTASAAVSPVVTNTGAANVLYTTATLQGEVTEGDPTPEVIVTWWASGESTNAIDMSIQSGAFSTDLSSLSENTTYFYTCTASNSVGTSTSAAKSFTTSLLGTLITPTVEDFSSQHSYGNGWRYAVNTVNASGLTDDNGTGVLGDGGDAHSNAEGVYWSTADDTFPAHITYDLGGSYDVNTMRIWNANQPPWHNEGIASMEVFAGATPATMTSRGVFAVAQASGLATYTGEEHAVSFAAVRYIKFDILSDHGGGVHSLAEVRFEGPPQAPAVTNAGTTNITTVTATLQGDVTAGLPVPAVTTHWGPAGNITNAIDNGAQSVAFSNKLSGLTAGMTYEYYFVASNAVGTASSTTGTFSTVAAAVPAAVTNGGATNVWLSGATLQGAVTAGDPSPTVTVTWWQSGGSSNVIDMGTQVGAFSTTINGLLGNTTYSYYCYATNSAGADTSATLSFTTELSTITPTVADVSSSLAAFDRYAVHTVDSSGMADANGSGVVGDAGDTHLQGEAGIAWTTPGNLGGAYGTDFDPTITYDLGGEYDVTTMRIWNYNSALQHPGGTTISIIGPDEVDVHTSADGVTFTLAETVNFAVAPGADGYMGQAIAVNYEGVRYIKFDIKTNHDGAVFDGTGARGGAVDGRSLTGLSEVRFQGVPGGDPILPATVVMVSSENPIDIDRDADHTVDGSGLTDANANGFLGDVGDTHINASDPGYVWTTVGNLGPTPPTDFDPTIIYDLGDVDVYDVSVMRIWNDNSAGFTHLAAKDVEVFAGRTLEALSSRGTFTFAQAPGLVSYTGQDIPVSFARVRYIKFDILTNHDGAVFDGTGTEGGTDGRHLAGLAEVRFKGRVSPASGMTLIVR